MGGGGEPPYEILSNIAYSPGVEAFIFFAHTMGRSSRSPQSRKKHLVAKHCMASVAR